MTSGPAQLAQDASHSPTGLRTGADYLSAIRDDGRQVIYDGEVVRDVTSHPAFRGAAQSIAGLWDIASDPAGLCSGAITSRGGRKISVRAAA
jgi:4-hydroxyphenylacetate 3-monooxygenase